MARLHMYDWIILLFLAVVDGLLNIIEPFHRFVGRDMMTDLRYPLKGNTIPFWAVPLIAIVLPWVVFGGIYFKKKNVYDLHHGILGILYSVLITAVITDAIKDGVGRPRPDFFWRCFPDGIPKFDNVTTNVICHGEKSVIKEGHKSFPSGHSSCKTCNASVLLSFEVPLYVSELISSFTCLATCIFYICFSTFSTYISKDFSPIFSFATVPSILVVASAFMQGIVRSTALQSDVLLVTMQDIYE